MTHPSDTYLVEPEHLHVMLWAGLWLGHIDAEPVFWPVLDQAGAMAHRDELTHATLDRIGQMLVDANAAAVNAVHGRDECYVYGYHDPRHAQWSTVEVLKAIHVYEWQCAPDPGWLYSPAFLFCRGLTERVIHYLPGYEQACGHITAAELPATSPLRAPHQP